MFNCLSFIMGHLVGDYLTQTHKQAIGKSVKGNKGRLLCFEHCWNYSMVVAFFVTFFGKWKLRPDNAIYFDFAVVFTIAFLSHWFIDRYQLALKWMKLVRQTRFEDTVKFDTWKDPWAEEYRIQIKNLRAFFVAIVYVGVDNTMHLVLMWLALSYVGRLAL